MGQIQLGDIAGKAAAGIYAAGIKFSEFWYFVPTMIFISVYPHLIETKMNNDK
jgi:O-antigen/teichoic acid export membrane protein